VFTALKTVSAAKEAVKVIQPLLNEHFEKTLEYLKMEEKNRAHQLNSLGVYVSIDTVLSISPLGDTNNKNIYIFF
jgi:muramoyltetrapeptide carboxypeptidase LdcA involved in peptidoglycan recycling